MTVDYVKQRVQFGRPLGALQVVQHYCADISTFADTSRMIAYQAASFIDAGLPCAKEVAMAKAWCSDAYKKSTQIAHQLHGGIGFTEEHDLHLYYKHAKVSELDFGDSGITAKVSAMVFRKDLRNRKGARDDRSGF
jgi:alkylation response protein AidB-like acyl-CoA dehydrogenase